MAGNARIAIGMASINAPKLLDRCVRSCLAQVGIQPQDVMIVANGPGVVYASARWEEEGVHVSRPGWNTGTCRAWNYCLDRAFSLGYDAVLITNDDVEFVDPETIRKYQARYSVDPGLRQLIYIAGEGYSAISITRPIHEESGPFDENIWPGYYCDNEHHYRVGMAGFPTDHLIVDKVHDRSSSLKQDQGFADAMATAFRMNQEYFVAKWGGMPKQETFTVPFNGGTPVAGTLERLPANLRQILECRYA